MSLHAGLRYWAKGIYPTEAGTEVLIRSGWADRLARSGWVDEGDWVDSIDGPIYYPRVGEYLNTGGHSGGERRQLRVIASFLGQRYTEDGDYVTVWLNDDLSGVDQSFVLLVMSAVGHAAGLHESWGSEPFPWQEPDEEE